MSDRSLLLLAPGLLGPIPEGAIALAEPLPATTRLLARASRRSEPGAGWLAPLTGGRVLPSGPVALLGAGGQPEGHYWLRADPVHLRADRDRLLLFAGDVVRPEPAESEALMAAFNRQFEEDGLTLVDHDGHWFLRSDTAWSVELPPTRQVAGGYLDRHLPAGANGRALRAFLNETQMLFHGHPVNAEREARGALALNGLWVWGGGRLPTLPPAAAVEVYTDDPLLRGIARLAGVEPQRSVSRCSQLPDSARPVITAWPEAEAALTAGDLSAWLKALASFESAWARELIGALDNGTLDRVTVAVESCGFTLRRWHLRRFWRRSRNLRRWLVTR